MGKDFSRAVGPLFMCEDQGEWIGYSISLEINFYVSILSMVQSLPTSMEEEERYFKGANFFFLEPPSFYIMDSKQTLTGSHFSEVEEKWSAIIDQYFLIAFADFVFTVP